MGSATRSIGVRDMTLFIAALSLTTARWASMRAHGRGSQRR